MLIKTLISFLFYLFIFFFLLMVSSNSANAPLFSSSYFPLVGLVVCVCVWDINNIFSPFYLSQLFKIPLVLVCVIWSSLRDEWILGGVQMKWIFLFEAWMMLDRCGLSMFCLTISVSFSISFVMGPIINKLDRFFP